MRDAQMPMGRRERAKQAQARTHHGRRARTVRRTRRRRGHDAAGRRPCRCRDRHAVPVCGHEGGAADHGAEPEVRRRHRHRPGRCSATDAEARWRASSRWSAQWWRACVSRSRTDAPTCTSSSSETPPSPTGAKDSPSAARLEDGIARLLSRDERIDGRDAATLARVITAIIQISTTATVYLHRSDDAVLSDIREQSAGHPDTASTPRMTGREQGDSARMWRISGRGGSPGLPRRRGRRGQPARPGATIPPRRLACM